MGNGKALNPAKCTIDSPLSVFFLIHSLTENLLYRLWQKKKAKKIPVMLLKSIKHLFEWWA